jgi:enterochelin esterase-like enzyme
LTAQQTPPAAPAGAPPAAGPRGGGRGAPPVKSPEVAADGRVTFRLRAPNAKEVAVAMGGNRLAMQKDEQGVWTATTADSLIAVNRQFEDWLRAKGVQFTELESPDVGHVWPYWRQNFTEFGQKAFQPNR